MLGVLLFRVLTVNARPELERLGELRPVRLPGPALPIGCRSGGA
jgi:cobalt/nickel transport system permease protein